jgi:uncharacterized protein YjbJ (UPF0337 family)
VTGVRSSHGDLTTAAPAVPPGRLTQNITAASGCTACEGVITWRDGSTDKDRIAGAAKQAKGVIKEAVGKAVGDAKLTADGKSDKVAGQFQNAVGGLKDSLRK